VKVLLNILFVLMSMYYILSLVIISFYITLNIYVSSKIKTAYYLNEGRRNIHRQLIWILPFIGPWALKSFWLEKQNKGLNVLTKSKRGNLSKKRHFSYKGSNSASSASGADY